MKKIYRQQYKSHLILIIMGLTIITFSLITSYYTISENISIRGTFLSLLLMSAGGYITQISFNSKRNIEAELDSIFMTGKDVIFKVEASRAEKELTKFDTSLIGNIYKMHIILKSGRVLYFALNLFDYIDIVEFLKAFAPNAEFI
jgi:hypothetical protein